MNPELFYSLCNVRGFNEMNGETYQEHITIILDKYLTEDVKEKILASETVEEALSEIRHLNSKGFSATIDILGEHTEDTDLARDITHQYCNLYEQIDNNGLDSTISVKPTHVGLNISNNYMNTPCKKY